MTSMTESLCMISALVGWDEVVDLPRGMAAPSVKATTAVSNYLLCSGKIGYMRRRVLQ